MPSVPMLVGASIRPAPDPARAWVERELSRPEYHQSLIEQFFGWLQEQWNALQASALDASPLSTGATVVVVAVLVVLAGLLLSRARRETGRLTDDDPMLGVGRVSPEQHRAAAEAALAGRGYDEAVVEAFRAVAAQSVQRGLLEERPGLTAHELADALAPLFPAQSDGLLDAAARFELVFYGDQRAHETDARAVLDLDDELRRARPVLDASRTDGLSAAVPG